MRSGGEYAERAKENQYSPAATTPLAPEESYRNIVEGEDYNREKMGYWKGKRGKHLPEEETAGAGRGDGEESERSLPRLGGDRGNQQHRATQQPRVFCGFRRLSKEGDSPRRRYAEK